MIYRWVHLRARWLNLSDSGMVFQNFYNVKRFKVTISWFQPFPEDITPKTLLKPSPTVSGHLADSNDLQASTSIHWLERPFKRGFFFDKNLKIRQIGTKFSFSIGKAFTRFISAKIQLLSWYESSLGKLPSPEGKIK